MRKKGTGVSPPLNFAGKHRAERLPSVFPGIIPDAFYTTAFIRTEATLEPWAKQANKMLLHYVPSLALNFADSLLKQKGKSIVIVGHSNTIPQLVNLSVQGKRSGTLKT